MEGTFERYGRTYHLLVRHFADLQTVLDLDDALWVATGAPIDSLRDDPVFLDLVDTDDNGRIMCFEVRAAIRWLQNHLKSFEAFEAESTDIALETIRSDGVDGGSILTAARKIAGQNHDAESAVSNVQQKVAAKQTVTLAQIRQVKKAAELRPVSELGVVLVEAGEDGEIRRFLEAILTVTGGAEHPSGGRGVTRSTIEQFVSEAQTWISWKTAGRDPSVKPLGDGTEAAAAIVQSLRPKIDEFFVISKALKLAPGAFDSEELGKRIALAVREGAADGISAALAGAPLAVPKPGGGLPLSGGENPYYEEQIRTFARDVVAPVLGDSVDTEELNEAGWRAVYSAFEPYQRWLANRPTSAVSALSEEDLETYLDPELRDRVSVLIDHAAETAVLLENVRLVEKLALYQGHLLRFLNNFVSFPFVYQPDSVAIFDMGRLVMDGRHFNLAIRVPDRAKHKTVAATSSMFVLYVRIIGGEARELAVPVTDGGVKNLAIGKRGLFRGVDGSEWDAEVVDMIQNPISVAETIVAPFKRIGGLITKKIETLTADAQARLDTATTEAVSVPKSETSAAAAANANSGGGLIAGSGVAIAAVGTALTYFARTISTLSVWRVLLGLAAAVAAVVIPMTVLALLKLRRRDLSAILEGSGWAVNLRMRLTRRQARYFTQMPRLPLTSRRGVVRRIVWTIAGIVFAALLALLYWFLFMRG